MISAALFVLFIGWPLVILIGWLSDEPVVTERRRKPPPLGMGSVKTLHKEGGTYGRQYRGYREERRRRA